MFILNLRVSHSLLPITQRHQTYVLPGPINGVQFVPNYYYQPFGFYGNGFASYPLGYPFFNGYSSYANRPYYFGAPGNISDYINYETNLLLRNVLNPRFYSNPPGNIMDRMNYQVDHYLMSQGVPPEVFNMGTNSAAFNILRNPANTHTVDYYPTFRVSA